MTLTVNTNVLSLNAQRNLGQSENLLGQALERLSSGLRINSAKDDAAGLAIAERLTTQIRGLNQAVRNANDGISLAQTTEGALDEVVENLQRIRELAVQSANGTNSADDRAALDAEVQQRLAEIDRIATQTTFNGLNLLDGTFGSATFQVGAQVGDTITLDLTQSVRTRDIGQIAQGSGTVDTNAINSGDLTINGVGVAASTNYAGEVARGETASSAFAKAAAINASGISGVTAQAETAITSTTGALTLATGGITFEADGDTNETYTLDINGTNILDITRSGVIGADDLTAEEVRDAINSVTGQTGVSATVSPTGQVQLISESGGDIRVNADYFEGATATGGSQVAFDSNGANVDVQGTVTLTSPTSAITVSNATANDLIGFGASGTFTLGFDTSTLDAVDVTTVSNAEDALNRVDAALATINATRGDLGAVQNRLESTISNLSNVVVNQEASRGRILDADFAAETAKLTRAQILQQAGVSVVSQANTAPQSVLGLLQG